jgi:hypothetical protein
MTCWQHEHQCSGNQQVTETTVIERLKLTGAEAWARVLVAFPGRGPAEQVYSVHVCVCVCVCRRPALES